MDQIRKYFEKDQELSDKDWQFFSSKLTKKEFSKKHQLLKIGQTENHLSFIEKGIIRFYIPKNEYEMTFTFVFANEFVSAYDSFLTRQPSTYIIETILPTIIWQISFDNLQDIYHNTAIGNAIGRQAAEDLFLKKAKREMTFLTESAEQRYLNLIENQTQVIKLIPLKYIASYIGITPQALSRIRKRIS